MDMLMGDEIAAANLIDWRKLAQGLHARIGHGCVDLELVTPTRSIAMTMTAASSSSSG